MMARTEPTTSPEVEKFNYIVKYNFTFYIFMSEDIAICKYPSKKNLKNPL